MSNYPRDEFDRVPESSSRQGVHRARLEPPKGGGLALVIIAGLIVLMIGAAAYFLLPNLNSGDSGPTASETESSQPAESTDDASADASDEASEPATDAASEEAAQDQAEGTAAPEEPEDTETAASASPDAAAVDMSTGVVVLNATNLAGMAGDASSRLTGQGWPVTFTGNWQGQPQPSSVIFYNGPEQLPNAQAIAGTLGIDRLVDTAALQQPLTVVVGPGFQ